MGTLAAVDMPKVNLWFLRIALGVLCFHTVLMPVMHTLNLLRFGQAVWVMYLYASFLIMPVAFFGALMLTKKPALKFLDPFEMFMLFVGFWALVMTLRYGGGGLDILGKVLRLVLVFSAYKCGRQLLDEATADRFLPILAKTSFAGVLLAVLIVNTGINLGIPGVVSIVGEYILIAIAYLLVAKPKYHYVALTVCLVVLFASGKRGNYMAAALMMVFYVFLMVRTGRLSLGVLRKPVAAVAATFAVIILGMTSLSATQYLDVLPKGLRSRIEVFTGEKSATEVTAGRNLEVVIATRELGYRSFGAITGLGLGASMPGVVGRTADTIHIQPLFLTFMLGVVGLGLYVWALGASLRPVYLPDLPWTDNDLILCLFAVGIMTTTLTSATFLQTPLLWLALGYMASRKPTESEPPMRLSAAPQGT